MQGVDQINEFKEAHALFVNCWLYHLRKDVLTNCSQDHTGNGTISSADMRIAIRALGQNPPEYELERIVRECDRNSAGHANLNYFL